MAAPLVYMLGINGWWKVEGPVLMSIIVMSMLLLWRHRDNIRRLLAGQEGRLGSKK